MKFTPTTGQIAAAQQLFIAMAYQEITKETFQEIENEILRTGIGINDGEFFLELSKKAKEAGFVHAEKAEVMAEEDVSRIETEFIKATFDIHKTPLEKLVTKNDRKKLLDILLKMFAPIVTDESLEEKRKAFFNERIIETVNVNYAYSNNEDSFQYFKSLKTFIPLEEFIGNPDNIEPYQGIEGILMYEPPFYFFQTKEDKAWQSEGRIISSSRYIIALADSKIIESDDLDTVERELFKVFLKSQDQL